MVNPFDIGQLADRLHEALTMTPAERAARSGRLAAAAAARSADHWLDDQLQSVGVTTG
jgi:trehalose 6-phosphate synthase